MDRLDKTVLHRLAATEASPAVTIYAPMHVGASPPHISENQIRLKNLLRESADKVRRVDKRAPLVKELEQTAARHHDDLGFWEGQTPGLLICAASGNLQMFHLPVDTEEYVAVDSHFHLAPVIGLLNDEREFYLLALAQHHPKLLKGSLLYGLEAPPDIHLPESVAKALNIDESNQKNENQGSTVGPSSRPNSFNGRGGSRNPEEEDRLRFFRIIDHIINRSADLKRPLLLAGTEEDVADYRRLSRHPQLLKSVIHGDLSTNNAQSLFQEASAIVRQELVLPAHRAALDDFYMISGARPERIAKDYRHISEAARQGRVDKLLAGLLRRTADTVRDKFEDVPRITFPKDARASKQLNDVALSVWQASGLVYSLLPDEMPDGALMAARLRY